MEKPKYKSEALERGLDIIELLAQKGAGLNMKDIAAALGKTKSQLYRNIQVLEQRNYIRSSESGTYFLTHKLNNLIISESQSTRLLGASREAMATFANEVKQPCHLSTYNNGKLVAIHQIDPPTRIGVNIRIGATIDIKTSGSGLCLMAFSDEVVRARIASEADLDEDYFESNKDAIERTILNGIVSEPSQDVIAITNFSCPVFDENHKVVAILTAPYLQMHESSWQKHASTISDIKQQLIAASTIISNQLKI